METGKTKQTENMVTHKMLHVPKTGGTVIKNSIVDNYTVVTGKEPLATKIPGLYYCDHDAQISNDAQYIVFLRDPIDRFVSHYVFLLNRKSGYDTDKYFIATTPQKLQHHRDINHFVMDPHFENFVPIAMKRNCHYALRGEEGVRYFRKNLFFVGRMEHLEEDFYTMQDKLGTTRIPLKKDYSNIMPIYLKKQTVLRNETRQKLREYLNDEYKLIRLLVEMGLVTKHYLKEIWA